MAWTLDARIPVHVFEDETALVAAAVKGGVAVLAEAPPPTLPAGAAALASFDLWLHPAACPCCGGRSTLAQALDRLFLARVRGQTPWFTEVLALLPSAEARAALAAALRDDAVVAARFRAAA